MAANFWASSHYKHLLDPEEVDVVNPIDKEKGLTQEEFKLIKIHMTNRAITSYSRSLGFRFLVFNLFAIWCLFFGWIVVFDSICCHALAIAFVQIFGGWLSKSKWGKGERDQLLLLLFWILYDEKERKLEIQDIQEEKKKKKKTCSLCIVWFMLILLVVEESALDMLLAFLATSCFVLFTNNPKNPT